MASEHFNAWWTQQVRENGGTEMGADFRHWAAKGYEAATLRQQAGRVDAAAIREVIDFMRSRRHGAIWEGGAADKLEAALAQNTQGEAVAIVGRAGASLGALFWTPEGQKADLPDGTKLYSYAATLRQQAARVDEVCEGCSGHGEVGGLTPHGYESHECPFCHGTGKEAALSAQPAPSFQQVARECHDYYGTLMGETPAQPVKRQGEAGSVDCIGLALDLEQQEKRAVSQTAARAMLAAARGLRLLHAAPVGVPEGWTDATTPPDVSKGQDKYFWIAVRRNGNDKVYVFPAVYANAYQLCCSDDEPCAVSGPFWAQQPSEEGDEGDIEITGWYDIKSNSEYDSYYTPVCSKGDVVVAWHKGPEFADAPSAPQGVE